MTEKINDGGPAFPLKFHPNTPDLSDYILKADAAQFVNALLLVRDLLGTEQDIKIIDGYLENAKKLGL